MATAEDVAAEAALALSWDPVPGRRARFLVWQQTFRGVAEEAHHAREFVRFLLAGFPRSDDVVQVAGELIANAVTHTLSGAPGGLFVVELRKWSTGIALTVADQGGPGEPRIGDGEELDEHGYGLRLVRSLASRLDWRGTPNGRSVTAVFTGPDAAAMVPAYGPTRTP